MTKSTPRTQEQRQEQDQKLEAIYDDIAQKPGIAKPKHLTGSNNVGDK